MGSIQMRSLTFILPLMAALFWGNLASAGAELVMVEEDGCVWCARWDEEISHIYPKTNEGKTAPLRRMDIHGARPDDLTFTKGLNFTPTFVLVIDGVEASRLEGYPGADFFWPLISDMMRQAGLALGESG